MRFHLGFLVLLSVLLVSEANSQEAQRLDFGGDRLFSYVPPQGWKVVEFPGLKYKIAYAAPAKAFAANINVVSEKYGRSLEDYARDNVAQMQSTGGGFALLGQTEFTTSEGLRGIKLITETDDMYSKEKRRLRQTQYLFNAGPEMLVVTCSALAEDGKALDQEFDAAMKTFRISNPSK
jgi:hypothetical protein